VPEETAIDIVYALGPDVKNPSAFVTRRVKTLLEDLDKGGHEMDDRGARHSQSLTIYQNGTPMRLEWRSRDFALERLVARGVLDQRSSDYLTKIPEEAALEIVSALGPEVRNPSAFVTKEVRKRLA